MDASRKSSCHRCPFSNPKFNVVHRNLGFPGGSDGKGSACKAGDMSLIRGLEDLLEKETTTYSSILAWEIPWTEEPGGLQSIEFKELDTTE